MHAFWTRSFRNHFHQRLQVACLLAAPPRPLDVEDMGMHPVRADKPGDIGGAAPQQRRP